MPYTFKLSKRLAISRAFPIQPPSRFVASINPAPSHLTRKHVAVRRLAAAVALAGLGLGLGCADTASVQMAGVVVDSLVILPRDAVIGRGRSVDLVALAYTSSGDTTTVDVTWTVSDGDFSGKGKAKGRHKPNGPGDHTVTASGGGDTDSTTVTVTSNPVASMSVTPDSITLLVGRSQQLTAAVQDSAGVVLTGETVTWTSSDSTVVAVDDGGVVTAIAPGTGSVTATSAGASASASVTAEAASVPPASFIDNASFESGFDGFVSGSFTAPTGVSRDATHAYAGSMAVRKSLRVTDGSDLGGGLMVPFYAESPLADYAPSLAVPA